MLGIAFAAQRHLVPSGPDTEFRCRLPDVKCDGCRGSITTDLAKVRGIRSTRFEGDDRKTLIIVHAASLSRESLNVALTNIGYPPESMAEAVSHAKCVCPTEQAKAATK